MGTGSRNFIGSTDFPSERSGTHFKKSYMFFWRLAPLTVVGQLRVSVGAHVCMVTHIARVWINRIRLPILLVVS